MRRPDKARGKSEKPQRRKALRPRRAPKAALRRGSHAIAKETDVEQLTREVAEAREREVATAEVLKVIGSSPGELQSVFEAILKNATRICEAKFANLFLYEDNSFRIAAHQNAPPAYAERWRKNPVHVVSVKASNPNPLDRLATTKSIVNITDLMAEPGYVKRDPRFVNLVESAGARTHLLVPMLKESGLVGGIAIYRQEVRPFTDKQIELVKNFAAQAVIAIENTRLLNELRESLQQQTATADVLRVISSSLGDVKPVFQEMLDKATQLCEAKFGHLYLWDGEAFNLVAMVNTPPALAQARLHSPLRPSPNEALGRMIASKSAVHIADLATAQAYIERSHSAVITAVELGGIRTFVAVPMLKENELIGALTIYRQEVRPFARKQIELVENFAAQAVIAIENARLLNEQRESLERQTATSEVLQVISSSPGELKPVFEAMLANATRICEAKIGILFRYENGSYRAMATLGVTQAYAEYLNTGPIRPGPTTGLGRVISTRQTIHIVDTLAEGTYADREPLRVATAELGGARTLLNVPMLKQGELIGALGIYRQEVRPFTDKQIELVTNFAAQAVIAIENARLLSELRESLQQQTATADVLKVISSSVSDLKPVFEIIGQSAEKLCAAEISVISMVEGDLIQLASINGVTKEGVEAVRNAFYPMRREDETVTARTIRSGTICHIPDVLDDPLYTRKDAAHAGGFRGSLGVPMIRDGQVIGSIFVARKQPGLFTDNQVQLLRTFADQAVIAIENVRLFDSVEARTRELAKSLENLRNTQDRLVQTQKLASLGQLTAGIAHEMKNPLNFVNNFSAVSSELIDELKQSLKDVSLDDEKRDEVGELMATLRGNLDKVVQHGKRADAIVKNMLQHSREGTGEHRPVDVNVLVEESLNLAWHGARAEKQGFEITLKQSFDPSAGEVDVFPQDIRRALLNLISNGFYAAKKRMEEANGGDYEPVIVASTKNLGNRVEIRIRDNGTGIAPDVKDKMFNPFFTTKPTGEGTGLGLSISHDIIVKQHAGSIEVETLPGEFTEIIVILPRAAVFV